MNALARILCIAGSGTLLLAGGNVGATAPVQAGTIATGQFTLRYQIEGEGPPAIVLAPPAYGSQIFSPNLRRHLRLVFLEHRVYAEPPAGKVDDAEFALDRLLDDTELARRQLALGRVAVIGFSGNAIIVLEYARKYPESVTHVVMVAMAPNLGDANKAAAQRYWAESVDADRKAAFEEAARRHSDDILAALPPEQRRAREYIRNGPKVWYDAHFDATPIRALMKSNPQGVAQVWGRVLRDIDISKELADFDRPVFLALGRYDFLVGPPSLWDPLRPAFRDLTIRIFERSGHTPQYEEPELFDAELLRWMSARSADAHSADVAADKGVSKGAASAAQENAGVRNDVNVIAEVTAKMQVYLAALRSLDFEGAIGHYLDDPQFRTYFDGQESGYAEFVATVRESLQQIRHFEGKVEGLVVTPLAPDAALASFRFVRTLTDSAGKTSRHRGTTTWVWVKRNGEWRIIHGHAVHIPMP